jgi:ANTAR domain
MIVNVQDWADDRERFVADGREAERLGQSTSKDHGRPFGPLGQQFATLTQALLHAQSVGDVLEQVVDATFRVVPQADVVSVTLRSPDGEFHTPVSTAAMGRVLDQVQYEVGEGPCLTAALDPGPGFAAWPQPGQVESPWPRFTARAQKLGVEAVLSISLLPAPIAPRLSGALNLYSRTASGLDDVDKDAILLIATHASLALASTEAVTTADLHNAHLRQAIDSRDVIGQAKGILMSRRGISAAEAFDILRRTSQHLNVKLVEIAGIITAQPDILD